MAGEVAPTALTIEQQIIDAAETCCRDFGPSKTTVADIASAAGLSRATVYRAFPGGRDAIFDAHRRSQIRSFFTTLSDALDAAESLAEAAGSAVHTAACALRDDTEVQRDLVSDPGSVLATFTGANLDRLLTAARVFIGPHFEPWLGRRAAAELAEWLTRFVISYFLEPSPHLDLCDRGDVDAFVRDRVMPAATSLDRHPVR